MTPALKENLDVISAFSELGRSPTLTEIAQARGLRSKSSIQVQLVRLQGLGVLQRDYRVETIFELIVETPPLDTPLDERRAFFALKALLARLGRAPTFDEIAAELGFSSKSSAHDRISALRERGLVRVDYHRREIFSLKHN